MVTLLIFSPLVRAESAPSAVPIKQGHLAPFDGILLSKPQAKIIYDQLQDYERVKLINKSLQTSIEVYKSSQDYYIDEVKTLTTQNVSLTQVVEKARSNNTWEKVLYFGLGMLITGATVYLVKH